MTMRSKQWYTNTSRLPNSFVNVSIGRPPLIESRQQDHRSDGRWSQNFKYVWLVFLERHDGEDSKTPSTDFFLDKHKPSYVGGMLEMANRRLFSSWYRWLVSGLRSDFRLL